MKFSKRMDRFGDEIFAALNEKRIELEKEGRTIYNLFVGTPDFPVADHIKEALIEAAKDPENWKYALRDMPELQEAVCSYYERRFGVTDIKPDMVSSCCGSEEGMGHIGLVLCDEGDTVLLPTPCYPVFIASAQMAGAEPYYYPMCAENGFLPKVSEIPEDVARKAKYMIVSLPSNPTGSVASPTIYEELIAFARKYDILIIHDNAYSDIIFDGNVGGSFFQHEGALDVGVEFFSLSKSFNVTGARISFLVGRKDVVAAFRKLRGQIDFGMFLPIQKAAIAALTGPTQRVKYQCSEYQDRRDALCGGLRSIGWDVPDSHGSMFVWAKIPEGHGSSMDFCMELMERSGVICTPGSSFGPMGEGYVRFALVLPKEQIRAAVRAIADCGILNSGRSEF
jgi:LL-diaminopimelate aminotransferase